MLISAQWFNTWFLRYQISLTAKAILSVISHWCPRNPWFDAFPIWSPNNLSTILLVLLGIWRIYVRAFIAGVANVPNTKYLVHLPHQTQKWCFMRCAKSQKLYNMATVPLQICNSTDKCCKNFIVLYSLFSLLSLHFFFSLLSHSPVPSLFSLYRFPLSSTSLGCSPATMTA